MSAVYEYRFTRHKVAEISATIRGPLDVVAAVGAALISEAESERLVAVLLDTKHHVIGLEVVYAGTVNSAHARMAELFRAAVRTNAAAVVLAHNHPSGDPTPSPDDLHLTAEAIAAGRLLDIEVLDHLVIGAAGAYRSLRDSGVTFSR